ncbi:isoprenylcysteine carboxylmethyltransferase family protein [Magnetospirillum sp. UT-4]|uniref:methyltransferase family protein n=1 Tax=Magnetospirillum sp. UT-4 TaxID=2681467 RepID=UPI001382C39B|nr:isoprenylcysteine carboxylmethyltransferase family protein [Magnetospirillum sp. UT-4]CAA7611595.1 conserved membrane hypothetical protein [Magnetospirillum sp. UT-4]
MSAHLAYALAWAAFALGHSGLALPAVKRRLRPWLGRRYRLAYNIVAVLQVALVMAVGGFALGDRPAFALPGWLAAGMGVVHLVGWGLLLWAARFYDLGRLGGLAQLRGESEDEGLRLDGPHAYVRHPLYAAGFLILWGGAFNPLGLATAVWGSLYLLLGTWAEERKLVALYGGAYLDYRARVPALLPWRGRVPPPG